MFWEDPEYGPSAQSIQQPKRVIYHIVRIYMLAIVVFSVLLLVVYYVDDSEAVELLFYIFTSLYHLLAILDEYQANKNQFKIYVSPNFHYLIYTLYNWIFSYTPTLYLTELIIAKGIDFILYMVTVLMPFADLNDPVSTKRIIELTKSKFVTTTPTIIELIILIRYIGYIFVDFGLYRIIDFIFYLVWIIFFNYSINPFSRNVWNYIGQFIEQASYNNKSIEPINKISTKIAEFSDKLYGKYKLLS